MINLTNKVYSKYTVLVVEDEPTMLATINSILSRIGFRNIHKTSNGMEALQKIQFNKYDLIISDRNMPNMDGLELLKQIRASEDPKIQSVPFILITIESNTDSILAAKQAGINNYIVKPLSVGTLKQKIDVTLGIN